MSKLELELKDFDESFKELEEQLHYAALNEDDEQRFNDMLIELDGLEIDELDDIQFDPDLSILYSNQGGSGTDHDQQTPAAQ